MDDFEKVRAAERHLAGLGLKQYEVAPPVHRLLWRFGFAIPPPLCASFAHLAMFNGALFGLGWGVLMWFGFWSWQDLRPSFWLAASVAAAAGVLFGLSMAWIIRRKARMLGIGSWSAFVEGLPPDGDV